MRIEMDKIYCGDSLQVLQTLPENAVDCCVTSPPYYALRDYGADGQIGREATPEEYVSRITAVFHEVKRVLTPEGTCWLNIADTYCGTGSKADHQDPKYPKGRNGQQVAFNHRAPRLQAQRFNWYSVACSPRLAGRRLVFAQFYHLAQNKPHAGKHAGQADPLL